MAEVDVSPELYAEIEKNFKSSVQSDSTIKSVVSKVNHKRATTKDIQRVAERLGKHASDALNSVLTVGDLPSGTMYWNIGEKTIKPLMETVYNTINTLAIGERRASDAVRGINIGISMGTNPADRIDTILGFAVKSKTPEELANALNLPVKTTALDFVDDFEKRNAEVRNGMGFTQTVIREYDGVGLNNGKEPCEWCIERAGTWSYQEAIDNGVFERHVGCGCTIEVVEGDQRSEDWDEESIPF